MSINIVYGADNEYYAFRESPELTESQRLHQSVIPDFSSGCHGDVRRCAACGELINKFEATLSGLKFKKRLDFSTTYDGIKVVSERFVKVYYENQLEGLVFRELPNTRSFYSACCSRTVIFDAKR